tara:strand:- start:33 stop:299 length:267 start_codon:yes stop_codon:yes gene_type:complete
MSDKVIKKPSPWIEHIKEFAKKQGITYAQSMKHADLKKDYVKAVPKPREKKAAKPAKANEVPLEIVYERPVKKTFKKVTTPKAAEAPM